MWTIQWNKWSLKCHHLDMDYVVGKEENNFLRYGWRGEKAKIDTRKYNEQLKKREKMLCDVIQPQFSLFLCVCVWVSTQFFSLNETSENPFSLLSLCVRELFPRIRSLNSRPKCVGNTHPKRRFKLKVVMALWSLKRHQNIFLVVEILFLCVRVNFFTAVFLRLHHIFFYEKAFLLCSFNVLDELLNSSLLQRLPLKHHWYWKTEEKSFLNFSRWTFIWIFVKFIQIWISHETL